MANNDLTNYISALKSKPIKKVELKTSKRAQALKAQKGKCAKCKKDLQPFFTKYIEDPLTKEITVVCSSCGTKVAKKY